jgi:hypothetical protein
MLNSDTKHDYISREASLLINKNGMYVVRSSEDKGRAAWQFMYSVDDRRNNLGDIIPGEKVRANVNDHNRIADGPVREYVRCSALLASYVRPSFLCRIVARRSVSFK